MRKTLFIITFPHLFSPISAFSAENKSNIITLRFNVRETIPNKSIELPYVQ